MANILFPSWLLCFLTYPTAISPSASSGATSNFLNSFLLCPTYIIILFGFCILYLKINSLSHLWYPSLNYPLSCFWKKKNKSRSGFDKIHAVIHPIFPFVSLALIIHVPFQCLPVAHGIPSLLPIHLRVFQLLPSPPWCSPRPCSITAVSHSSIMFHLALSQFFWTPVKLPTRSVLFCKSPCFS